MITENLATEIGVVNGTKGRLKQIVYEPGAYEMDTAEDSITDILSKPPLYVLVELENPRHKHIMSLPSRVIPITPRWSDIDIEYKTMGGQTKKIHVSRLQLPLIPCYVLTDYKCQGQRQLLIL